MALTPTHIMQIAEHHFAHRDAILPSIRGQESIVAFAQEIERTVASDVRQNALESDPRVNRLFALLGVDEQGDDTSGVPVVEGESMFPNYSVSYRSLSRLAVQVGVTHNHELVESVLREIGKTDSLKSLNPTRAHNVFEWLSRALTLPAASGQKLSLRMNPKAGMAWEFTYVGK